MRLHLSEDCLTKAFSAVQESPRAILIFYEALVQKVLFAQKIFLNLPQRFSSSSLSCIEASTLYLNERNPLQ